MFIECPIYSAAQKFPTKIAYQISDKPWTYETFNQRIGRLQISIRQLHLPRNCVITLEARTRSYASIYALMWAAWREGHTVLPLDPDLPQRTIQQLIANSQSVLHFGQHSEHSARHIPLPILETMATQGLYPLNAPPVMHANTMATVVATSGSTGSAKLTGLSVGNLFANAAGANQFTPLNHSHIWLLALPIHHVSGLGILWRCALAGATVAPQGETETWIDSMRRIAPSHVSLVPTQLQDWVARYVAVPSLMTVLVGGAETSLAVLNEATSLGIPIRLTYGCTEMGGQITTSDIITASQQMVTYGHALPHREVRVASNGQLQVRGDCLFQGYWNEQVWAKETTADGWFNTGDTGKLTQNGLEITGRQDSMYISGGKNIYPEEIEQIFWNQLKIYTCVVPVPDERFGQVGVAILAMNPEEKSPIKEQLLTHLPRYKIPKYQIFWPRHISHESLKIPRFQLAQWIKTEKKLIPLD